MLPRYDPEKLSIAFQTAQGVAPRASSELATALVAAAQVGEAAWPTLRSDWIGFAAFLGHRIPGDVDPVTALRPRAFADLYLAHACLAADPHALAQLDEHYLKPLPDILARQHTTFDLATETVQQLRVRLLTGERPLLLAYGGTGELRGWLRVTATRMAIRVQRNERREQEKDDTARLAASATAPDLEYQRKLYQDEFRNAFAEALAILSVRERNLLKQSVLYAATSDDLAALYHVHRTTAARWLVDARTHLACETRNRIVDKLRISRSDYESILHLIQSQLDVSVARLLGG